MARLLRDGLEAGGIGFSSSWGRAHLDGAGAPVPSRSADAAELIALASVAQQFEGTSLEFIPPLVDSFTPEIVDLLTSMSVAAGSPLNWNVMRVTGDTTKEGAALLEAGAEARRRGGAVVALTMPIPSRARFSFGTGFVLEMLPEWGPVMALPHAERKAALADPETRRRLAEGRGRRRARSARSGGGTPG